MRAWKIKGYKIFFTLHQVETYSDWKEKQCPLRFTENIMY